MLHPTYLGTDALAKTGATEAWDKFVAEMSGVNGTIFTQVKGKSNPPWLAHAHSPSQAGQQPDFGVGMLAPFVGPDWGNPYALRMFLPALYFECCRPFNHRHDASSYTGDTTAIIPAISPGLDSQVIDYDVFEEKLFLWPSRAHSQGDSLVRRLVTNVVSVAAGAVTTITLTDATTQTETAPVRIIGVTPVTNPDVNGSFTATITSGTTITIPIATTGLGPYSGGSVEFKHNPTDPAGNVIGYKNSHFPASRFPIVALLTGSGMLLEVCESLEANYRYMCQNNAAQVAWNAAYYVTGRSERIERPLRAHRRALQESQRAALEAQRYDRLLAGIGRQRALLPERCRVGDDHPGPAHLVVDGLHMGADRLGRRPRAARDRRTGRGSERDP
jgi:hypothetical protein